MFDGLKPLPFPLIVLLLPRGGVLELILLFLIRDIRRRSASSQIANNAKVIVALIFVRSERKSSCFVSEYVFAEFDRHLGGATCQFCAFDSVFEGTFV